MMMHQLHRRPHERRRPGQQFVEQHPRRVQVDPRTDPLTAELLGRHILRRAHDHSGRRRRDPTPHSADDMRDPEVEQLDPLPTAMVVDEHHIRRLDVAMHDPVVMRRVERIEHGADDTDRSVGFERPVFAQHRVERSTVDVILHDVKQPVGLLAQLDQTDPIAMRRHMRQRARLQHEPPAQIGRIMPGAPDHLDRHRPLDRRLERMVDRAKATPPEQPRKRVPPAQGAPDEPGAGRRALREVSHAPGRLLAHRPHRRCCVPTVHALKRSHIPCSARATALDPLAHLPPPSSLKHVGGRSLEVVGSSFRRHGPRRSSPAGSPRPALAASRSARPWPKSMLQRGGLRGSGTDGKATSLESAIILPAATGTSFSLTEGRRTKHPSTEERGHLEPQQHPRRIADEEVSQALHPATEDA